MNGIFYTKTKKGYDMCHKKSTTGGRTENTSAHVILIENFNFVSNTNLWHLKIPLTIKKRINKIIDHKLKMASDVDRWKSLK